jgi:outer membrane receptor protein involved in Fe transport
VTAKLLVLFAVVVCLHAIVGAQPITTGGVRGKVIIKSSGEPAVGATIVATSPALQGEQTAIADETGSYFLTELAPGMYTLTVYYGGSELRRDNVLIRLGKQAVVNLALDQAGEVVEVTGTAPFVDQGSTKTGVTLTEEYTRNIPVEHRLSGTLGAAAGAERDLYGTSLAGGSSPENAYIIDGIVASHPTDGVLSTDLPSEFIAETEIITGGYNAEYGRAMGGIVNVITKQGGNTCHGSVFYYFQPAALVAKARTIDVEGGSISSRTDLTHRYDLGAELGGPIVKDRLWFHLGFDPHATYEATTRTIARQVDDDQNGVPDRDPDTGFTKREPVARSRLPTHHKTYYFTAKLTSALGTNHRGQLGAFGNPTTAVDLVGVQRAPAITLRRASRGSYNAYGRWTSKLDGGATELAAITGYHRTYDLPHVPRQPTVSYSYERSLYDFADVETAGINGCDDRTPDDPYPLIRNCPITQYPEQGHGFVVRYRDARITGAGSMTRRARFAGHHVLKAGIDFEKLAQRSTFLISGGAWLRRGPNASNGAPGRWRVLQIARVVRNLSPEEREDSERIALEDDQLLCINGLAACQIVDEAPDISRQLNGGAYVQDTWLVAPHLTLDAGVRWDRQNVYRSDATGGKVSPDGELMPARALQLDNFAPRVGVIIDPTREGRAKLFGHYGRYYEPLPLSLNALFGTAALALTSLNDNRRLPTHPAYDPSCNADHGTPNLVDTILSCSDRVGPQVLAGGGYSFVAEGLRGQFTEEVVAGVEYEVMRDVRVGAVYQHRGVPVVVEDLSLDASSYFVANPGENFDAEARGWRVKAAQAQDLALADAYRRRADQLERVNEFDKPIRNYDAVQLTAVQRPTRRSLVLASYTYSSARGNYPGLFLPENGQLAPNITELFDLQEMLSNRYGPLAQDRPHNFKADAFYQLESGAVALTLGGSLRMRSGIAHTARAAARTGAYRGGSFLLPAGSLLRSPATTQVDCHLSLAYQLGDRSRLEGFVRVFNVFDHQEELAVDESYTFEVANPIVGGDRDDLEHLKAIDETGHELGRTVVRNRNFGHVIQRQSPRSIQIGARWIF